MTSTPDDAPRGFVAKADFQRLQAKCDLLECEIAELRASLRPDLSVIFAAHLPITRAQARYLVAFYVRDLASRDYLYEAIYGLRENAPEPRIVDVQVCLLRQRMKRTSAPDPFIRTIWGSGYALTPEGRAWLEANIPELFTKGAAHVSR